MTKYFRDSTGNYASMEILPSSASYILFVPKDKPPEVLVVFGLQTKHDQNIPRLYWDGVSKSFMCEDKHIFVYEDGVYNSRTRPYHMYVQLLTKRDSGSPVSLIENALDLRDQLLSTVTIRPSLANVQGYHNDLDINSLTYG